MKQSLLKILLFISLAINAPCGNAEQLASQSAVFDKTALHVISSKELEELKKISFSLKSIKPGDDIEELNSIDAIIKETWCQVTSINIQKLSSYKHVD
ncbi:MAG: hypothetical protein V4501_02920 [Pseudomonadota bacterium]